jgi:hypothetical protein
MSGQRTPARRTASFAGLLALGISSASASAAAGAADLGELHRMFGIGIGETARPPAELKSLTTGGICLCPDFCTADLPELGSLGSISVRWRLAGTDCRAELMTVEANPLRERPAAFSEAAAGLFGLSRADIVGRYGAPRSASDIAGGQIVYCGLVGDYGRTGVAGIAGEVIFTAFHFDGGRLLAIRVGLGTCPVNAFIPVTG